MLHSRYYQDPVIAMLPDYWLPRPDAASDQTTQAAFDALLKSALAAGDGAPISYHLPAPRWQFVCYAADHYDLAWHGSGVPDIALFEPRQANDLNDFGNQKAVYRDIERQRARMRASLEQAMCRGDAFTGAELRMLLSHPVLAPLLRQLVFIGEALAGYPVQGGAQLEGHDGSRRGLPAGARLRIAHPHDLLAGGAWHLWQRECFVTERVQPFKQVFRELYLLTAQESDQGSVSGRYAGHQVNARQAAGLLTARGWVMAPDEGPRRIFHDEGLAAWLNFQAGAFTPLEVEAPTIAEVTFGRLGEWKPLDLEAVPPRVFSEVMRDVDLVVSVAHAGGVDPEASASTVAMRTTLVRETCARLRLENVRLEGRHALVDGCLGHYSVHLGSAVVHRQPGGALCIVPVHGQHHGRLFLPFADDDPKTAEVVSKVLLLARDQEIRDPTILEQIRATA